MIRRTWIGLILVLTLASGACATATPSTDGPGPSPTPPSSPSATDPDAPASPAVSDAAGGGELPAALVQAIGDPSRERLSKAEQDLRAEFDARTGLTALIGPDGQSWLQDQRSEAVRAALGKWGVDTTALGPTRLSSAPVASLDGDITAMVISWIGSGIGAAALVEGSPGNMGSDPYSNSSTSSSQIEGNQGSHHIASTITTAMSVQITGSTVIVDVTVTEQETVTDRTTGASLGTSNGRSHIHVELQMCPDANGKVEATVTNDMTSDGPGGASLATTSTATIHATVNDAAYLASEDRTIDTTLDGMDAGVRRHGSSSMGWTSTYGATGTTSNTTGTSFTSQGDYTPAEMAATAGVMGIMQSIVSDTALKTAQTAWRGGKCVRIDASERSRKVRPNEVINFTAQPFQRVEGVRLAKPVVAAFAGEQSLSPVDTPVDAPASFTFTASANDKVGSITLTTTSNRGIGKLSIDFEVKFQGWYIDQAFGKGKIKGKKCGNDPYGTWKLTGTYSFLGYDGKQTWKIEVTDTEVVNNVDTWTGTYVYKDRSEGPFGVHQDYDATGTVRLAINPDNGDVFMNLKEKTRRQRAWTDNRGAGWSNAPLLPPQDLTWTNDAGC